MLDQAAGVPAPPGCQAKTTGALTDEAALPPGHQAPGLAPSPGPRPWAPDPGVSHPGLTASRDQLMPPLTSICTWRASAGDQCGHGFPKIKCTG